jgi:hypothetical protein
MKPSLNIEVTDFTSHLMSRPKQRTNQSLQLCLPSSFEFLKIKICSKVMNILVVGVGDWVREMSQISSTARPCCESVLLWMFFAEVRMLSLLRRMLDYNRRRY